MRLLRKRRPRRLAGLAVALAGLALAACAPNERARPPADVYMDSLAVFLGELRRMDHELGKLVHDKAVNIEVLVPQIENNLQPTLSGLRQRAAQQTVVDSVRVVHEDFVRYLDVRLEAYDAALQGYRDDRPELYELFGRRQVQADSIGRRVQSEAQRLRGQDPGGG